MTPMSAEKKRVATPLLIEIAVHYACCGVEFERLHTPACSEAVFKFVRLGLIKDRGIDAKPRFEATDGLRLWVDTLCTVPFPEHRWVIPE